MKNKTHSGAKKRMRLLASGKVKHKKQGLKHLLEWKRSKRKRALGKMAYVSKENMRAARLLLNP